MNPETERLSSSEPITFRDQESFLKGLKTCNKLAAIAIWEIQELVDTRIDDANGIVVEVENILVPVNLSDFDDPDFL